MPNGVAPAGSDTGEDASSLREPPDTAKALMLAGAVDDISEAAARVEGDVEGLKAGPLVKRSVTEKREGTVSRNRIARMVLGPRVDGEQKRAVERNRDPACACLAVQERRARDSGQRAVSTRSESRHAAVTDTIVRIRDKQLVRVRRPEGAPERSFPFGGERRTWGRCQEPIGANDKAIDERRRVIHAEASGGQLSAGAVEENVDRSRAGDRGRSSRDRGERPPEFSRKPL